MRRFSPRRLSQLQAYALIVLLRMPMHAYAVRQEIIALTNDTLWPTKSGVHAALNKLIKAGLIRECLSSPNPWLKAKRGAPYEITKEGRFVIGQEIETYRHIIMLGLAKLQRYDDRVAAEPWRYE